MRPVCLTKEKDFVRAACMPKQAKKAQHLRRIEQANLAISSFNVQKVAKQQKDDINNSRTKPNSDCHMLQRSRLFLAVFGLNGKR